MALNEQMQQMIQQDIQDAETRPKEEILKEQMEGLKTAGRTARDIAVESIPGVSEALAEKRVDEALQRGDTTGAMIEGAAGLMGAVPMVGDAAAKGLRAVTKSFRKQDINQAEKLVDNPDKLKEWQEANTLPESQRQKNIPEAQQAAEDLFQGNIKSKEARKRIKEVFPEPKLYTAEDMPEMPTVTDVVGSMGKKAEKGILGVKGFDLEPGQRVGARLDIPAYNNYDKWVVSIHDGKIRNGSVVGYGQAIRLKNIEFGSDPEVALDIAKGKRVAKKSGEEKPMGKATIARVFGDYVPEDPYELQDFAKKVLADKDSGWTQVGMNPYRGSYFYNKETGKVVTRADEVIQVGPLVLAKNVTEPKLSELKELFSQKTARTKDGKLRLFNEGGVVPMKRMAKQMELFEPVERGFEEGGLMEEGGMVDEESGNEVPPGSLREEVRDDIPAQLSEGEFVFPADVVRYIGLEKLMMMRQEAKQGLAQMEAMGQMGNGDEAVVEDDLPFDMYDLDIEDEEEYNGELEMAVGGYVAPPVPFQQQPYNQPTQVNPQTGTYTLPGTGIAGYQVPSGGQTGFTPYGGAAPYFQPVQFTGPQFQTSLQTTNLPTFGETVGTRPGQYDELRTYVNDAGQILQIPFKNGQPIYPIPEGYRLQSDQPQEEAPATIPLSTGVRQTDGGGGDGPATASPSVTGTVTGLTSTASTLSQTGGFLTADIAANANAYGGNAKFGLSNAAMRDATKNLGAYQSATIGALGMATALGKGFGLTDVDMNDMAKAGQAGKVAALTSMGMARPGQITTDAQATYYGNMINAALDAQKEGLDIRDAMAKEMNSPAYAEALQAAATTAMEDVGYSAADLSNPASVSRAIAGYNALASEYEAAANATAKSGTVTSARTGQPVTSARTGQPVMSLSARQEMNAQLEAAATARAKAEALAAQAARAKGNVERGTSTTDVALARSIADKATKAAEKAGLDYGDEFGNIPDTPQGPSFDDSAVGRGSERSGSSMADRGGGPGVGGGSNADGSQGGGAVGGGGCFEKGTLFKMADGTTKCVEDIKPGDKMYKGGLVYAVMQGDGLLEDWYDYNGIHVTSAHPVLDNGTWKRVGETSSKKAIDKREVYYSLMNTNHLMIAENGTEFTDFVEISADIGGRGEWMMEMLNQRQAA